MTLFLFDTSLFSATEKQTTLQKHLSLPESLKIIISCLPVLQERPVLPEQVKMLEGEIIQAVNQSAMGIKKKKQSLYDN